MNNKKKLWLATEFFYPEYSMATGYFLTGIAEKLSEKYNVEVICASSNKINDGKKIRKEKWNSISITRLRGGCINKNNLSLRTLKFLYFSIQYFFILLFRCKKNDSLCVVTNPAPLVIIGALIAKVKKIKYTIIVHDIFPENLVGANIISSKSFFYKMILPIFNWAYFKADILITMGNDMSKVIKNKIPNFNGQIKVIPNWADIESINVADKNESRIIKELKLDNKLVITFAGNIGRAQGIPELISNIKKVANKNVHFLFFGNGAMQNLIIETQKEFPNINYCGSFPRSEKHIFLTAADIALIPLAKGMAGLGVPSKTYDYLASGKPIFVLADEKSEIAQLVLEHKLGWVCPPNEPIRFKEIIEQILNQPQQLIDFKDNSKKVALRYFSKEVILNKYIQTI